MISEATRLIHERDLRDIESALVPLGSIKTKFFEPSEGIPFHSLLVYFGDDEKGRARYLNLIFLALAEGEFDSVKMLQYYFEFPFEVNPEYTESLRTLFTSLNLAIPFGHFGIKGEQTPIWRYVQVMPVDAKFDLGTVHEVLSFISFILDSNFPEIEQAAGF
ncbi:MAG: hypothetical protein H6581_06135 [Bacteroidia bacterium]|nr:hypothetical protein [Bacteroidia bacterium]